MSRFASFGRFRALAARFTPACLALVTMLGCQRTGDPSLPESPSTLIPIRRVVLYQNGVGYFEREGTLDGDVLTLQIRPSQVNDLLKSLTVVDTGSGRAVSVSLPLEKGGDRVLAELPEQVRNAGGLLDVLHVFRGARVVIHGREGSAEGRVVGVENLTEGAGEKVPPDWRATLRTEDGELVVYSVKAITSVEIQDRTLAVGLDQSLDVSLKEGNWKPVTLAIRLTGEGEHHLRASYIVEMPRWKPAYRLVVGTEQPLLQGWAVVDNVSGEDWRNVQLSLVAGTPMSFLYDLHTPQYTRRPDLTPRRESVAVAPPEEDPGILAKPDAERKKSKKTMSADRDEYEEEALEDEKEARDDAFGEGAGMAPPRSAPAPEPPPPPAQFDEMLEEQAAPEAEATVMGSLFRYDLPDRVTVPDRSSTLVAIVNQRVDAEEVVYFRPEETSTGGHPYRAVRFTNNTQFTLEKGPVTLYSKGTFTGEGFVNRIEPGATHMIPYAVDSKVTMDSDFSTEEEGLRLLRITDGQIVSEVLSLERTTYTIKNLGTEPITAYVKTHKRPEWTLKQTPPGTIDTADHLLVPVKVPAQGNAKLPIEWTRHYPRTLGIDTALSTRVLQVYIQGGNVPKEVADKLQKVLDIKRKLGELEREMSRLRTQHRDLSRDQDRVRANLNTLRKTQGNQALERELAAKLLELEKQLSELSGNLVRLSEQHATLEREMIVVIRTVSLTTPAKQ